MEKVACKLVLLVSSPSSAFVRATSQIKANLTEHRMNPGTAEMLGTVVQSVNRKKGTNVQTHKDHQSLNDRFYTRDALPVWTSFGKHFVIRPVIRL